MRSSARLRKSFANVGVARADRKRQGFDFVGSLRIRVARGVRAATARGAVTASVCRTPASLWNRDDTIEAVSEVLRMPRSRSPGSGRPRAAAGGTANRAGYAWWPSAVSRTSASRRRNASLSSAERRATNPER